MAAMNRPAILFSEMSPPPPLEADFNAWYDEEHIPLRMKLRDFVSAQRYRDSASRNYLAVYEMRSEQALSTPEYMRVKSEPSDQTRQMLGAVSGFTRYLGRLIADHGTTGDRDAVLDAPVLYPVFFTVPADRLSDFDAWYSEDHIPLLLQDERWLGVRRFAIFDGHPNRFNRLALHYLADRAVLESDARQQARSTPWRARLAAEPWFKGHYMVFDRFGERFRSQHA